jgi:alanine-synthesizing transaminase
MSESAFPIRLSQRMSQLPDYMFEKINLLRQQLRREGHDLIDMSMGNPKDPTPKPIVDKLTEAAADPRNHRYSVAAGIINLRTELAKYYAAQYDVQLNPADEAICTIGSKEGFSHLTLALLGHGETALVPAPAYPIHSYSVVLAGATPIPLNVEDDREMLRALVRLCEQGRPRPKVLFINYPHNPTGKCVELPFFEEIVAIARRFELIVVHDFAYGRLTYDGFRHPSFLEAKGAKEVGLEFGTFSKSYNMAGWRVGYALGNKDIIKALNRIKGYYDYGIFQALQIAAIIALRHGEPFIAAQVEIYRKRRDVVVQGLRQAGWEVEPNRGGMFLWVRIPEPFAAEGSYAFAMRLLQEAQVVVSPGVGFGPEGEGYVRMALVENEKRLRQATRGIRQSFGIGEALRKAQ